MTVPLLAILSTHSSLSLHAQTTPIPPVQLIQEAFRGEMVYTQDARELQFTLSSDVTRNRLQAPGTISFAAEYGLTSAWQVSLEWQVPAFQIGNATAGTLAAGIKRAWMGLGGSQVDLAVGTSLAFPFSGPERIQATEVESFAVLATDAARGNLHAFVGLSLGALPLRSVGSDEEASGLSWNAGLIRRLGRFRVVTELDRQRHGEMTFTPGIVWSGSSSLQIGIAAPIGLTTTGDRPQLIAKVTYEFSSDH